MKKNVENPPSPLGMAVYVVTLFHILGFVLFVFLIRPMWLEISNFLSAAAGIRLNYIVIILILTGIIAFYLALRIFIILIRKSDASAFFKIFVVSLFVVYNGLLFYLNISEAKTSIPAIVSLTSVCFYYAVFALLYLIFIYLLQLLANARNDKQKKMLIKRELTYTKLYSFIVFVFFIVLGAWSVNADMNKWQKQQQAACEHWKASWISIPDTSFLQKLAPSVFKYKENMWIGFRKNLHINEVPGRLIAKIGADSKYWLWINGRLVVFEGALKRGPNPYDTYYDTIDIAPFLKRGENSFAILLWYFGKDGFGHKDSQSAGIIFESIDREINILSDATWSATVHPAYYSTHAPVPNYRLEESNVGFNAQDDLPDWTQPEYDFSDWNKAAVIAAPCEEPFNNLVKRPVPLLKIGKLSEYVSVRIDNDKTSNKTIHCRLPYNAQITPYLMVKARAGLKIDIKTDNYFGGSEYNVRAEYITKDGPQEFESFGWMNGHDVLYTMPKEVEVLDLKYRETGYDTGFTGGFQCNDSYFNTLWQKSRRTLYLCMRDHIFGCPDRERGQWWGDIVSIMPQIFYSLESNADLAVKKAIHELVDWQKKDGALYSPVPAGNWFIELPTQMLASIGYYGFWTYYLYTGDRETIEKAYGPSKKYIMLYQNRPDGLVEIRPGQWNWIDWGSNIDGELLYNEWYYLALVGLKNMAVLLDKKADVAFFDEKMKRFENSFNRVFWTGTQYKSPGFEGDTDDRGNALAVAANLARPEYHDNIKQVLIDKQYSSTFMEKYVFEAFVKMGFENEAFTRLKNRFDKMVRSSHTTLWEGWEIGSFEYGGGTINHAWSGIGITVLSQFAAGISPVSPGYKKFQVMPHEGYLTSINDTVRTPYGDIALSIKKDTAIYRLSITVPENTTAEIYLHKHNALNKPAAAITMNDSIVFSSTKALVEPAGVKIDKTPNDYYKIKVLPGIHEFQVEYD